MRVILSFGLVKAIFPKWKRREYCKIPVLRTSLVTKSRIQNVQIEEMQNVPFRVRKILYHIDRQEYQDGSVVCCGWALAKTWNGKVLPVDIKAVMPDGTVVTAELKRYPRADVADALKLRRTCDVNLNLGFDCVFIVPRETEWKLIFSLGKRSAEYDYQNK